MKGLWLGHVMAICWCLSTRSTCAHADSSQHECVPRKPKEEDQNAAITAKLFDLSDGVLITQSWMIKIYMANERITLYGLLLRLCLWSSFLEIFQQQQGGGDKSIGRQ